MVMSRQNRDFSISIEIVSIIETNFWKPSRFSRPSRLILFWRRDRDHVETNRDPQAYKNLNTAKSRLKSLDFKNLDQEKIKTGLDSKDNLDGYQKLVWSLDNLNLDWSRLLRPPGLSITNTHMNQFIFHPNFYFLLSKSPTLINSASVHVLV